MTSRVKLLLCLATMPDEAFSWFVAWALQNDFKWPGKFKFPDGLGGFRPESRSAIEQLRAAATEYMNKQG